MREFDRIKAPAQRLLERREGVRLDGDDVDPRGRAALFSANTVNASAGGGVALHCSRCDATTGVEARAALRAALPLFLVAPWRDHPVFAVCPSCGVRSWLAIRAGE